MRATTIAYWQIRQWYAGHPPAQQHAAAVAAEVSDLMMTELSIRPASDGWALEADFDPCLGPGARDWAVRASNTAGDLVMSRAELAGRLVRREVLWRTR